MKKQTQSFFDKKNLKVLTKKETRSIKGGNSTSGSTNGEGTETNIVIEDIIQI